MSKKKQIYETYSAPNWAWSAIWTAISKTLDGKPLTESQFEKLRLANKEVSFDGDGVEPLSRS